MSNNRDRNEYEDNEEHKKEECKKEIILRLPNFDINNLKYWNLSWTKMTTIYGKIMRGILPISIIGCTVFNTVSIFNCGNESTISGIICSAAFRGFFTGLLTAVAFPLAIPSGITLFFLTRK